MEQSANLLCGDEIALNMMRDYSKACAAFAREFSPENARAMDAKRKALLDHAAQREHSISAAIDRLVSAAEASGRGFDTAEARDAALTAREQRQSELRAIIGLS